jgi:hypothetical protein
MSTLRKGECYGCNGHDNCQRRETGPASDVGSIRSVRINHVLKEYLFNTWLSTYS